MSQELKIDFRCSKIKIDVLELNEDTFEVIIEPGDATRYEFYFRFVDQTYIKCASLEGPILRGYTFIINEILTYANEAIKTNELIDNYFINYIVEHSECNPWTARALCLAVYLVYNKNAKN